jgi:hypothetical protein
MIRRRRLVTAAAVAVAAVATGLSAAGAASADATDLHRIVASWPSSYEVSGTKSEPLYTEHIRLTRDGDAFGVRIDVLGQGDAALGTQVSAVRVTGDGTVRWTEGCTPASTRCDDDPAVRGFLSTAALVGLIRSGAPVPPAVARHFHGTPVVCVDDALLHPAAPAATVRLDPCFDRRTGAVLAHWSPASGAYVGATLAPGFSIDSTL